jgi:type IV secretion system protein VirB4
MWNLGEYRKHPQRLADHLPWATLIAPGVMLNKDGSLQKTIAFRGPDLDSSTPYELVAARARMNNVLRRLGSHWCVHVEASRRLAHVYPASDFPNPVAAMIDQERRDSFTADGGLRAGAIRRPVQDSIYRGAPAWMGRRLRGTADGADACTRGGQ